MTSSQPLHCQLQECYSRQHQKHWRHAGHMWQVTKHWHRADMEHGAVASRWTLSQWLPTHSPSSQSHIVAHLDHTTNQCRKNLFHSKTSHKLMCRNVLALNSRILLVITLSRSNRLYTEYQCISLTKITTDVHLPQRPWISSTRKQH